MSGVARLPSLNHQPIQELLGRLSIKLVMEWVIYRSLILLRVDRARGERGLPGAKKEE